MKYRPLGKSGARVSEICLGAMTFGEADEKSFMHQVGASEEVSHAMMTRALDAGVNFWDTANVYNDGLSETRLDVTFAIQPLAKLIRALAMSGLSVRTGTPTASTRCTGERTKLAIMSMSWIMRSNTTSTSVPRSTNGAKR